MAESNQDQYESWNEENVRLGELNKKNYLGNRKGDVSTFKYWDISGKIYCKFGNVCYTLGPKIKFLSFILLDLQQTLALRYKTKVKV